MRTLILNLIALVALNVAAAPITATSRQITDDQFTRVCVPVLTNIYAMIDGELVPLTKYIRTTAGSITTTPTSIVPAPDSYRVHAVVDDDSVLLSWPAGVQCLPNIITRLPTAPAVGSIISLQLVALNQRHTMALDNGQTITLTMHMLFNPRPATPTELLTAFRAGTTFVVLLDGSVFHVSRAS